MDVDSNSGAPKEDKSQPDLSRRGFVRKSGKALYLAPTLTLLGSVPALAQFGSPPPPPSGAALAAPEAPAPTE
jgi:hypothetical protein